MLTTRTYLVVLESIAGAGAIYQTRMTFRADCIHDLLTQLLTKEARRSDSVVAVRIERHVAEEPGDPV